MRALQGYPQIREPCAVTLEVDIGEEVPVTVVLNLRDTPGGQYDRIRPLIYPNTDVIVLCYAIDLPFSLKAVAEEVGIPSLTAILLYRC